MDTIHVTMKDTLNNDAIVEREIDISNFSVIDSQGLDYVTSDPEVQKEILDEWIDERGNPQHDTILSLVSWYIV